MKTRDWDLHINALGWLHLLSSAIFLVIGFLSLIFMAGIGIVSQDPEAFTVLSIIGVSSATLFAILALPGLVAGYGLLKRYPWARFLALIVAFFNLANFPIGSAIGVYTFVVLLQEDMGNQFAAPKTA